MRKTKSCRADAIIPTRHDVIAATQRFPLLPKITAEGIIIPWCEFHRCVDSASVRIGHGELALPMPTALFSFPHRLFYAYDFEIASPFYKICKSKPSLLNCSRRRRLFFCLSLTEYSLFSPVPCGAGNTLRRIRMKPDRYSKGQSETRRPK